MLLEPKTGSYVELFGLPEDAPSPTAVVPIPQASQAVLVMVSHLTSDEGTASVADILC